MLRGLYRLDDRVFISKSGLDDFTGLHSTLTPALAVVRVSANEQSTAINPQGNTVVRGNAIYIPRRSPRIIEQLQQGESIDIEKERGKKRCHDSACSDNESTETKRQEKCRTYGTNGTAGASRERVILVYRKKRLVL